MLVNPYFYLIIASLFLILGLYLLILAINNFNKELNGNNKFQNILQTTLDIIIQSPFSLTVWQLFFSFLFIAFSLGILLIFTGVIG